MNDMTKSNCCDILNKLLDTIEGYLQTLLNNLITFLIDLLHLFTILYITSIHYNYSKSFKEIRCKWLDIDGRIKMMVKTEINQTTHRKTSDLTNSFLLK